MKTALVAVRLVSISVIVLAGCASKGSDETEDDLQSTVLLSGNGPAPVKNQRTGCDSADFRKVNIGPFGSCREIFLDRDPPTTSEIESWSAYDIRIAMPPGWAPRDLKELVITNEETGLSRTLRPVLFAPLTVYLHRQVVFGLQVKEGANRLTFSFARKDAPANEAPLVYASTVSFRKRSTEKTPVPR